MPRLGRLARIVTRLGEHGLTLPGPPFYSRRHRSIATFHPEVSVTARFSSLSRRFPLKRSRPPFSTASSAG